MYIFFCVVLIFSLCAFSSSSPTTSPSQLAVAGGPNFGALQEAGIDALMPISSHLGESASSDLSLLTRAIASFGLCSLCQDAPALREPVRASQLAGHLGLSSGCVLDVSANGPTTDNPWDFSQSSSRDSVMHIMRSERPVLLLGSLDCPAHGSS